MGWEAPSVPLLKGQNNKNQEASVVDWPVALLITYSVPDVLHVESCRCNPSPESYTYQVIGLVAAFHST